MQLRSVDPVRHSTPAKNKERTWSPSPVHPSRHTPPRCTLIRRGVRFSRCSDLLGPARYEVQSATTNPHRPALPHPVEQHRFEASGNDLRHPWRQQHDIEYDRRGGSKDPGPALLGHLVRIRLNRSRTAWSSWRLTSRVMTAPSNRVSTIRDTRSCGGATNAFRSPPSATDLPRSGVRERVLSRTNSGDRVGLAPPVPHISCWTNDGRRVSKQLQDAGDPSLWTTIRHRDGPVLHKGATNFTPHLRGLRHIRVQMSFTAETGH